MRTLMILAAATTLIAAPAAASEIRPFDRFTFAALRAHERPVVVFVHAPWCSICRAQEQTVRRLLATPPYQGVTVLTIDYDSQKPLWTKFGVRTQSTLIAYHGRRETSRLAYDADPAKVTAVLASALR